MSTAMMSDEMLLMQLHKGLAGAAILSLSEGKNNPDFALVEIWQQLWMTHCRICALLKRGHTATNVTFCRTCELSKRPHTATNNSLQDL